MGWLQGSRLRGTEQTKHSWTGACFDKSNHFDNIASFEHVAHVSSQNDSSLMSKQTENTQQLDHEEDTIHCTTSELGSLPKAGLGRTARHRPAAPKYTTRSEEDIHRPLQDESIDDEELPLIPREEVICKKLPINEDGLINENHSNCLWIVVDNIVYDCSDFVDDHPGGKQVIFSFVGEDCSWQFWRFHSRSVMRQYGSALRIGRTKDVLNRFQEPPKYVGLSRLGHDEW